MNELSNLVLTDILAKYKVELSLTREEYKLFMFTIEGVERNYQSSMVPLHKDYVSLKEKIIQSHSKFNVKKKRENQKEKEEAP